MDSDVAIADLGQSGEEREALRVEGADDRVEADDAVGERASPVGALALRRGRSEERRVGKECRL